VTDRSVLDDHLLLLTGDGVAAAPERAAALINAACEAGSAEAASVLATLEAMGVGRPQSWDRAFDYLALAAERGSERAKAQLALVNRDALPALLTAPERRSICDDPRIRVIEGFASAAECDWIRGIGDGRLEHAQVWDPESGGVRADPDRTNKAVELKITQMDVVAAILRARISSATGLPVPVFEPAQVMHYEVGQEFRPHHDYLDPAKQGYAQQLARFGQRIATFLLFLNDDYEGGETVFPELGLKHRGAKGDALFFANIDRSGRPDPRTLHAGRPPARGEKWILSQWIRDRTAAPA
jgi:prolyl 4-hydroxylase